MNSSSTFDPYAGNILVTPLGPIKDRQTVAAGLTYLPEVPDQPGQIPRHLRMHYLIRLHDFHWPSLEGFRIQESLDLMLRDSYRYRDPKVPGTWSIIGNEKLAHQTPRAPAMAAVIVGHSGSGKTESILRPLSLYPQQVVTHETFPNICGKHRQLIWLSTDVPASGRSDDLAANLMSAFDDVMAKHVPDWQGRFATLLNRSRRDGQKMLDEWRQVAAAHFLGLLHLDEVQNFFKLPTLEKRRSRSAKASDLQLSIIEDQCLKWILTLTNTWQIPIILSGTPDGVGALMRRFANTQRFVGGGYHPVKHFNSALDPAFFNDNPAIPGFLNILGRYQFVAKPLEIDRNIAIKVHSLTGGIPRLIVALWIAAHRIALESPKNDLLSQDHLQKAAETYLAPVKEAVQALLSNDPRLIARFEDLMPRDDNFWPTFWTSMHSR